MVRASLNGAFARAISCCRVENDPWIYILSSKNKKIHKLVKHNSSWRVLKGDCSLTLALSSLSSSNKYVLYFPDAEGEPALYMAKIPEEILTQ
ncbi:oligogalacturonate lyase family protein [Escherichia coli]